ncbi:MULTISPECIES: ComEA family DNA-binding protein [Streptomyces]|uniref:Helix-hairpin-helix domain-containing protein n=1 Tax=Streptomyces bacillaris TaxID=68179 RepID=A0ABW6E2I0_9ACTN|nr:ComEA family DNA-binding protein [Streptomyces nanshensis]
MVDAPVPEAYSLEDKAGTSAQEQKQKQEQEQAGGQARVWEPEPVPDPAPEQVRESRAVRLQDRVLLWVRLRWGLAPRTLAALTLVLLVAVGLAAFHFWSVRPQEVRAPEAVVVGDAAVAEDPLRAGAGAKGGGAVPRPVAGAPPSPPPEPAGEIVVDVAGKVHRPGVQRLPAGSRVADALRAAGGVRAGADVTGLNRARVLMDGEQVRVGLPQAPADQAASGAAGGVAGASGPSGPAAPLSLSTATKEQLETLPGVGPVLAQHIIDHRTESGGFRSVDELRQVSGIGDRRFADLRPLVQP